MGGASSKSCVRRAEWGAGWPREYGKQVCSCSESSPLPVGLGVTHEGRALQSREEMGLEGEGTGHGEGVLAWVGGAGGAILWSPAGGGREQWRVPTGRTVPLGFLGSHSWSNRGADV